jgi:hypothetical protein
MRKSVHLPTALVALVLMLSLVLLLPVVVSAQEKPNTIETDDYVIEFPTRTWKAVPAPRPRLTVYVNGDSEEEDVRLVIHLSLEGGIDIPEFARYDSDRHVRPYLHGYTGLSKETDFRGHLRGMVFTYEYTQLREGVSKPMAGRVYYLKYHVPTQAWVWKLRFTGERGKLQRIQDQIDAIARSFRSK